ncbi:hypothetical protein HYV57_04970 [Candidatus Peregrinibacteria bacterium]|nr:hypothetical protein [Candidatus Peregrinibacteria bacterium]
MNKRSLSILTLSLLVLSLSISPIALAQSDETTGTSNDTTTTPSDTSTPDASTTSTDPSTTSTDGTTTTPDTSTTSTDGSSTSTDGTNTTTDVTSESSTETSTDTTNVDTKMNIMKKMKSAKALNAQKAMEAAKKLKSAEAFKEKFMMQATGAKHKFTPKKHALGHQRAYQNRKSVENIVNNLKKVSTNWEALREQMIKGNNSYIKFLELLKRQLDSQIASGGITSLSDTSFVDNDILVIKSFNEAYASVTKEWIKSVKEKSGSEVNAEELANNTLASIATVQVIYNYYVSSLGVIGGTGLLTAQANETALEKQYTLANVTLPEQVKVYGENMLKLSGDDLNNFITYYTNRIASDLVVHLDAITVETDKAIAIYTNDIAAANGIFTSVNELMTMLKTLVDDPSQFTTDTLTDLLENLATIAASIKAATESLANGDPRANAQIRAITEHYTELTNATLKFYADLAFEYSSRNDANQCRKWKTSDSSECTYKE